MLKRGKSLYVTQSVLTKAAKIGLLGAMPSDLSLSQQIRKMVAQSVLRTPKGSKHEPIEKGISRKYGDFYFVVRDNSVVDIAVTNGTWCQECFGVGVFCAPDGFMTDCPSCGFDKPNNLI